MEDKLKQGETLFAEGKIEEAEKCFLDFLDQNPEDAEALNNLGVLHYARGNVQEAEGYFLKAIEAKEDYPDALLNLADLYQNAKRWKEAALQLEKSIAIDDQDHNLLNQLGMVYLEMGNTEKARPTLKKSLELNPDQETIRESLERLEKRDMAPNYLPTPGFFRGAFAEINITPNVSEQNPLFLQGMGGPPRKATAVSSPLMMQLLLLEDDHFTKVLFITADLFGFGSEIVDSVRALTAQWGIEPEGLILNASHTHYAPGTISHTSKSIGPFYSEYAKQIVQAIGQQLPILYDKLEECKLSWGKVEAQIGVSRRLKKDGKVIFAPNPEGYYDKDTPFLLLHMLKSDKKILLVNHGCHPTGLGSENIISADYPGYMRNALKSSGVVDGVMFLQGGAGSTKESVSVNGEVQFCEDSIGAKENGEILATQIMNGLKKEFQPVEDSFFCTRRQISLPFKPPPPPSVLAQIRDNAGTDNLVREWASTLLDRFPNGDFPATLAMEIQLVFLGDKVSFVTLPGEPVAELARDLRRLASNPDSTFVLGYTNGLIGYLPTDVMIEEGGYETEGSQFAYLLPSALDRGTESTIISATEQCVSAAEDRERPNAYGRYHLAKEKQKAFFVLSAGRCGTMTLAHLLNTATNARVWHHPQPDPIKESLLAYWGNIDKRKAFWKARYPIIHKTWSEGLVHGETDLLMTPFCDMLAEEIPDAKFIVLVRNPRDYVRSGMRRNYYHGHPWDFGRLRPKEETEEFEGWNKLDQFGKVCWLWRKTYEYILKITSAISKHRVFVARFEDLVRSDSKTEELFEFLGLHGFDCNKIEQVLENKFNSQQGGHFPEPKEWSKDLSMKLWKECGKIASTLGYRDDGSDNRLLGDSTSETELIQSIKYGEKKKLLFLELPGASTGGHLDHIVEHLSDGYQVKYVKSSDHNEITNLVNWADIVWLEWANQMAVHVTNKIPQIKDKKVICRLHGYEVFTDMPAHINWSVVDSLLFVAKHKQEIFNKKFKIQSPPQAVIRNGVNTSKFTVAKNKQNTKRLVLLGHLNFRKGLPILLHFYHQLLKHDPEYYLYIRGEFQDPRLEMAAHTMIGELSLTNKLEFVDWVDDLNAWFADKSHILSFSLEESFHYAIGNGMAAGLKPVIHAWNESRDIWPEEFIFSDLDGFLNIMLDETYEPKRYRQLMLENNDSRGQLAQVEALITEITKSKGDSKAEYIIQANRSGDIDAKRVLESHNTSVRGEKILSGNTKNYIVTGIPRSGTSLFSVLMNKLDNCVCLNEIAYDVPNLPQFFAEVRKCLLIGQPIPNKYYSDGGLATDTHGGKVEVQRKVQTGVDENALIGSKVNIPYLGNIQQLLEFGYKIIALVRDPKFAIASWNSRKAGSIPENQVMPGNLHPRWKNFPFRTKDKYNRQVELWQYFADILWQHRDKIKIVRYEDLTEKTSQVMRDVCEYLGVVNTLAVDVTNLNIASRYEDFEGISKTVDKYCPERVNFGYDISQSKGWQHLKESGGAKERRERTIHDVFISPPEWSQKEKARFEKDRCPNKSKGPILMEKGQDPSRLIIAFGGMAHKLFLPPFEFFRVTNSLSYSRILVRDFNQAWYHLGIDQNLTSFEAVLDQLRQLIGEMKPETICTVGTFAGGYAALAFGHYLNADYVHALAPQTFVDAENREKVGERRWEPQIKNLYRNQPKTSWFYDLRNLLKNYNGKTIYTLHISNNHAVDRFYGDHLEDIEGVVIKRYPCDNHRLGEYMKKYDLLDSLFEVPERKSSRTVTKTGDSDATPVAPIRYNVIVDKTVKAESLETIKAHYNITINQLYLTRSDYEEWLWHFFPDWRERYGHSYHKKLIELYITYYVLSPKSNDTYMDVAGGFNTYADKIRCRKRYLQGISISGNLKRFLGNGMEYIESDAAEILLPEKSISKMSCHHSFEHFQGNSDRAFIREVQRLLQVGGKCCIVPIFIADKYVEVTRMNKQHCHYDRGAQYIVDPTARITGGPSCGDYARIYDISSFQGRVIDQIDRTEFGVTLSEICIGGQQVPDLGLSCHKGITKVNYPYRVLTIERLN